MERREKDMQEQGADQSGRMLFFGQTDEAAELAEKTLKRYEKKYVDSDTHLYAACADALQERMIFGNRDARRKIIISPCPFGLATLHHIMGRILADREDYDEAMNHLLKAASLAPRHAKFTLTIAEVFAEFDPDSAPTYITVAQQSVYTPEDMCSSLCALARFFAAKKMYNEAATMCVIANNYECEIGEPGELLIEILSKAGTVKLLTDAQVEKLKNKYAFTTEPYANVLRLVFDCFTEIIKNGGGDDSDDEFFGNLLRNLMENDVIKKKLNEIFDIDIDE